MKKVYAKHEPYWDTGHLGEVIQELRVYGPPTLRAAEFGGEYFALEGSHRLAGAHYLGLEPKLVIEEDAFSGTDEFWHKVVEGLPCYEFERVHVLDLETMK